MLILCHNLLTETNTIKTMLQTIFTHFTALTALITLGSVVLHDANIDKALGTQIGAISLVTRSSETDMTGKLIRPETSQHTHTERTSLSRVIKDLNANPRIQPRQETHRRTSQRRISKGFWEFDGYRVLLAMLAR